MAIYLDHAATTRVCPAAATAALHVMTEAYGNPSSRHRLGTDAAAALAEHRSQIAQALSCQAEELFFTSGGTEADNWAVSIATQRNRRVGRHIITTAVEHSAVLEPIRALEQQGYEVTYLLPDKTGHISISQLKRCPSRGYYPGFYDAGEQRNWLHLPSARSLRAATNPTI